MRTPVLHLRLYYWAKHYHLCWWWWGYRRPQWLLSAHTPSYTIVSKAFFLSTRQSHAPRMPMLWTEPKMSPVLDAVIHLSPLSFWDKGYFQLNYSPELLDTTTLVTFMWIYSICMIYTLQYIIICPYYYFTIPNLMGWMTYIQPPQHHSYTSSTQAQCLT